ncbi:hypothetical protein ACWGF3_11335 [Streptomyces xanthophaeus]|uniref:Uncharacterized protein n=1 Tax=Streptomyces xanthophaeus TaxID=67385 RepID=A0A919GXI9_9ACTN|nr:hypothetical protein [Streptomyces xanthophaeus]GHI82973.1 hypothetical protein Sxan_03370 [Streptomyces xanthophaeus]
MKLSGELLSESTLREMIGWFVHVIEAAGALIILVGAVWAFARFTTTGIRGRSLLGEFNKIRLSLGRILGVLRLLRGAGPHPSTTPRTAAPGSS